MRRHLSFVLAIAAVGACTFPEPNYVSGDDGSPANDSGGVDRSASSSSGGSDASSSSSGGDASGDRTTPGDGSGDAISETSSSSSSGGDGSGNCDQDNDTYNGPQCGGSDCCDTDSNAHPNQTMFFAAADKCGSFDYNCNGTFDPEYGNTLSCTGLPATGCNNHCSGVSNCNLAFLGGDPGCGMPGPIGDCQSNTTGLACVPTSTGMQVQECN